MRPENSPDLHRARRRRDVSAARLAHRIVETLERRLLLADISGYKYYDLNRDGSRDPDEPGIAGTIVYLDAGTPGVFDGTVVSSTDIPKPIEDLATASSTLSVANFVGTIEHLAVTINITHGWDPDLVITLTSPAGTSVSLVSGLGGRGHDFDNTTFDDAAATNILDGTAPYVGLFHPVGNLAALNGEDPNGVWTLQAADIYAGLAGSIDSWSIQINATDRSATTDAAGAFHFMDLSPGEYTVRDIDTPGWINSEPIDGMYDVTLAAAESSLNDIDFGSFLPPSNIRGRLYSDINGNGTYDPTDPALSGWTVYLDTNNNGIKDTSELSVLTDAAGQYSFDSLTPATYRVRVVVQAGYTQINPGPGGTILVAPGSTASSGSNNTKPATSKPAASKPAATKPTASKPAASKPASTSQTTGAKYSFTEILADLDGRAALTNLNNYINANPRTPIRNLFDLSRGQSFQILRTTPETTLSLLRLRAGVDPQQAVAALQQIPVVRWASLNLVYDRDQLGDPRELVPNDPGYANQWFHTVMQNNLAWDTTLGSANIVVAVTDDGLDINHVDLASGVWTNADEIAGDGIDNDGNGYVDDIHGWDFWQNDNNVAPISADRHGTHVVGIVGARTNNGVGVAGTAGGVTVMPIRFYSTGGGNTWNSALIAQSYAYAVNNGANIVTTSYNIDSFANDPTFIAAVQYIYDHGAIDFNSAGNTNTLNPPRQNLGQTFYVANTNSADVKNSSSSYGFGIDLAAPGTDIYSTVPGNGYTNMTGTSMASPNAAAVAALVWSVHPDWTRDQVAAQVVATADSIDAQNPNYVGLLGSGRVNSFKAVTNTIAPPKLRPNPIIGLPAEGATITGAPTTFTVDVANVLDPAAANNIANWKLIGAGADGAFGTADDTSVALSMSGSYLIATNRLRFNITGAASMTSGQYRFIATTGLTDPFGQTIDGNGDGTGGDAYTRTFNFIAVNGAYTIGLATDETVEGVDFAMFPTVFNGSNFTLAKHAGSALIDIWVDHDPLRDPADYSVDPALLRDTLHFVGTSGDDSFTLDESNGSPLALAAGAIFSGGDGVDQVWVLGSSSADVVAFHGGPGGGGSGGVIGFAGNFSHEQTEDIIFNGAGGDDAVSVDGGPLVSLQPGQHLASLDIVGGSVETKSGVELGLVTKSLSIRSGGKLDLHDSDLLIDYTGASPLTAIQSLIAAARAGGAWTGAGLTSSATAANSAGNTTLGLMEAGDYPGGSAFDTEPLDGTALLVKYTYYGDTDFNGAVNFDDYVRTDNGFNNGLTGWLNGDFDLNNQVNFDDYVLIDLAFNTQTDVL